MRLNENTYPAYMCLESGNLHQLEIDAMFGEELLSTPKEFSAFSSVLKTIYKQVVNRYYITKPFEDAIKTAMPKIVDKDKHINNIPSDCGILFNENGFTLYLSSPADKEIKLLVLGFTKRILTTYGIIDKDGNFKGIGCDIKDGKPFNNTAHLASYLNSVLVTLYFIHNCEIEQKLIKAKEKQKLNNQKFFNESKSNITILDCKWFTELVRDTPFNVRGHYRWQVHGEKNTKRKLKWIAEFQKDGYHRRAEKEITL